MLTMSTTKMLNVRVPEQIFTQLEKLATLTERSKSFLTINALQNMIDAEAWQIQDIHNGIIEADNGDFASNEEVTKFFAKYDC